MKVILSEYSIENSDRGLVEQYMSTKDDIGEIVSSLILAQFSAMGAESKVIGSLFSQTFIDSCYNEITKDRSP
jgi:hypothetical protein